MTRWKWAGVAAIALCTTLAVAQDAPESLLPPGFDDPAPPPPTRSRPTAPSTQTPSASSASETSTTGTAVVQPLPGVHVPPMPDLGSVDLSDIPSDEELEAMTSDELDELLGLKPKYDIPPAARRAMTRVGVLDSSEGGMPNQMLGRQPASLVRSTLAGTKGPLVSRWGHILLRRVLASRLAAPEGMSPVEFATLRIGLLNRMGEYAAARAVAQDVDTANWNDAMMGAAIDAYVATADITGACPAVRLSRTDRNDGEWKLLQAICNAYAGEGTSAGRDLNRALGQEIAPRIDVLLAQRFAGAAGRGQRAVDIEWDGVEELTPWRFALANAVGEEIPEGLRANAGPYYQRIWATAPMLSLVQRAIGADLAAREGVLSAAAMVDLYSQIYANDEIDGDAATRATQLREAYVGEDPVDRIAAMQQLWGGDVASDYGRYVLTAYAAARIPASEDLADDAAPLLASMLTAGLDRDAIAWANVVEEGSQAWALVILARAGNRGTIPGSLIDSFVDDDDSSDQRKSRFLLAGLAGLGRIEQGDVAKFSDQLEVDLARQTKWSRMIDLAAERNNPALVALLAGLGMQGDSWDKMTARHLYHIVSALNRVGLGAEARMIAAEAVARG
ncbi:hypothetical protein IM511_02755 [Erythrobacteraceae bacterium E2-1 Yellow Sea]|nr:hypothetical protein [Erythrobacteraceae bacterium E2-1 Yellow Sea]